MQKLLTAKGLSGVPTTTTSTTNTMQCNGSKNTFVCTSENSITQPVNKSSDNERPSVLELSDSSGSSSCQSSTENETKSSSPQPLEYEYLRNILYNYMMGKQRRQMAKVLTALVHFTPSQVQEILAKVEEQENHKEKKSNSWTIG